MTARDPILFVFATLIEAEPFLARLSVIELGAHPAALYAATARGCSRFLVLICGMGPAAASAALDGTIARYAPCRVLNCGVAGSLSEALAIGEIRQISAVADASSYVTPLNPATLAYLSAPHELITPLPRHVGRARLLSQAVPVFDPARRAVLSARGDLIDMEGAAVARLCRGRALPCGLIKVVSDHANDRATLLGNLAHTSRRLADFLIYHLDTLLQPETAHDAQRSHTAC